MLDRDNIMIIEFEQPYSGLKSIPMVALFNKNRVTEADAKEAIQMYPIGEPDDVVIITKKQYESVFMKTADE